MRQLINCLEGPRTLRCSKTFKRSAVSLSGLIRYETTLSVYENSEPYLSKEKGPNPCRMVIAQNQRLSISPSHSLKINVAAPRRGRVDRYPRQAADWTQHFWTLWVSGHSISLPETVLADYPQCGDHGGPCNKEQHYHLPEWSSSNRARDKSFWDSSFLVTNILPGQTSLSHKSNKHSIEAKNLDLVGWFWHRGW